MSPFSPGAALGHSARVGLPSVVAAGSRLPLKVSVRPTSNAKGVR